MSWRTVVVQGIAKLDYSLGFMVVRKQSGTKRVHLSEMTILLIESTTVSLTTALLSELVKRKIKVIFCDEKHNPESELQPYYGCHDTSLKVRKQMVWQEKAKKALWTDIVREKIKQQKRLLDECYLEEQSNVLSAYIDEMEFGDETNREGHAAKVYFNALFGLAFTRQLECPTNAALNYGYGIILSCFSREIAINGYLTQIGLFHDNIFNQFNLSSDLMEPYRILVDRKVVAMQPQCFGTEEKMSLVGLLNETVYIDEKAQTIINAIKIYCKSVFEALEFDELSLVKHYQYEL